jgi:hypothetical protein
MEIDLQHVCEMSSAPTQEPTESPTQAPNVAPAEASTEEPTEASVDPSVHCSDGKLDYDETHVDCGGECDPCEAGLLCVEGKDCVSGECGEDSRCAEALTQEPTESPTQEPTESPTQAPNVAPAEASTEEPTEASVDPSVHCADGKLDYDETDIDCGASCSPCEAGLLCAEGKDCVSGECGEDSHCAEASTQEPTELEHCTDGKLDYGETYIDCGGECDPCEAGGMCAEGKDCVSGECGEDSQCTAGSDDLVPTPEPTPEPTFSEASMAIALAAAGGGTAPTPTEAPTETESAADIDAEVDALLAGMIPGGSVAAEDTEIVSELVEDLDDVSTDDAPTDEDDDIDHLLAGMLGGGNSGLVPTSDEDATVGSLFSGDDVSTDDEPTDADDDIDHLLAGMMGGGNGIDIDVQIETPDHKVAHIEDLLSQDDFTDLLSDHLEDQDVIADSNHLSKRKRGGLKMDSSSEVVYLKEKSGEDAAPSKWSTLMPATLGFVAVVVAVSVMAGVLSIRRARSGSQTLDQVRENQQQILFQLQPCVNVL